MPITLKRVKLDSNLNKILSNLSKIKETTKSYNAKIIAVTKYYPLQAMIDAYSAGISDFGENRVQEATEKINSLDDVIRQKCNYHLIGHLQTNKVKRAVGFFNLIHSVDSVKLADEISKKAKDSRLIQEVLVQVNNAGEEQKFGVAPSQLESLLENISLMENIKVKGLMTIAPLGADDSLLKKLFSMMYELKEKYQLEELSMGMSNDYKIALDCGATMIRLGRILFE